MELFRKLREKPRGLFGMHVCVRFARHTVFSCENKRCRSPASPFPSRPEEPWRQSGGGEAGAPGRAVLREEAQRLLHTPEVLASNTIEAIYC